MWLAREAEADMKAAASEGEGSVESVSQFPPKDENPIESLFQIGPYMSVSG